MLVQLDKEPYQVQVEIKKAAVAAAEADLAAAKAQVQRPGGPDPGNRFKLEHAIEDVNNQIANLGAAVATLNSRKATLELAKANLKRGEELAPGGGISKEDLDQRRQTVKVDEAAVEQALQTVYAIRVGLGLPAQPAKGHDLDRGAARPRSELLHRPPGAGGRCSRARPSSVTSRPPGTRPRSRPSTDFYKQDPQGQPRPHLRPASFPTRPPIKQAEAKLLQAQQRPGPGRAEPPLLRRRQRDRRRGDPPQRQPRQQRPGGAKPDGRPLAHGDLDRRQLQGNPAGGPAHRPARALRGGHVRQPAGVRGPHHRLHHGHRSNPRPAAAAERHGQLRQDRPAAAGPHRTDRLRPRQGSLVRRPVGRRPTCTTRNRPRGRTPGTSCNRSRPLPQAPTDPKP